MLVIYFQVHESEDHKDDDVSEDVELCSAESADDVSEDDCIAKNITHNVKRRRKHHTLWSLPEVLKLVEGVSEYGVGRWTEIKRVLFPSHAHRTSVDLKVVTVFYLVVCIYIHYLDQSSKLN